MQGVVGSFTFTGKGSTMNPLESFMNGLDLGKKISPIGTGNKVALAARVQGNHRNERIVERLALSRLFSTRCPLTQCRSATKRHS